MKAIKDGGFKKTQARIQGDEIRVTSPSKDELQAVIAMLRGRTSASSSSLATTAAERRLLLAAALALVGATRRAWPAGS